MDDSHELAQQLAELEARVEALEEVVHVRDEAARRARASLAQLKRRSGAPTWDGAQRAALRFVVVALGCVGLVTGGAALDATLGGVTIVAAFGVLMVEGLR